MLRKNCPCIQRVPGPLKVFNFHAINGVCKNWPSGVWQVPGPQHFCEMSLQRTHLLWKSTMRLAELWSIASIFPCGNRRSSSSVCLAAPWVTKTGWCWPLAVSICQRKLIHHKNWLHLWQVPGSWKVLRCVFHAAILAWSLRASSRHDPCARRRKYTAPHSTS